jgi:class 3 adenylate cyclase
VKKSSAAADTKLSVSPPVSPAAEPKTPPVEKRKLAAVMVTDMVGYSAMAQKNEQLAMQVLEEHRKILRQQFAQFSGVEVKTMGDGILAEFESVVQAVNCALAIQDKIEEYNAAASEEKGFQIRIGIHIGDIIYKENDIYGDGVNIASRIQPLAEVGGICISQDVYNQIRTRGDYQIEPMGEVSLKNILMPVSLYKVLTTVQQFKRLEEEQLRHAREEGKKAARQQKIQEYLQKTRDALAKGMPENALLEVSKVNALEPSHAEAKSLEESVMMLRKEQWKKKIEDAKVLPHQVPLESYKRILQFALRDGRELSDEEEKALREFRAAYNITDEEHTNVENALRTGL